MLPSRVKMPGLICPVSNGARQAGFVLKHSATVPREFNSGCSSYYYHPDENKLPQPNCFHHSSVKTNAPRSASRLAALVTMPLYYHSSHSFTCPRSARPLKTLSFCLASCFALLSPMLALTPPPSLINKLEGQVLLSPYGVLSPFWGVC